MMRIRVVLFACFALACVACSSADLRMQDRESALHELQRRGLAFDVDGLKAATRRENDDGAYLFATAGFFETMDDAGYLALLRHAASTRNHGLLRMLLRHPRTHRYQPAELSAALLDAIGNDSPDMLGLLLDHGASPDPDTLFHAAYQDDRDLARRLIDAGASFDAGENAEAVEMAARLGNLETLKGFVESGRVPPDQVAGALLRAALTEKLDVVRYLVGQGVAVDHPDGDGCTALHYMAQDGTVEMVAYLLEQGADINKTCRGRQTPLRWAEYGDNREIIDYLVARGAVSH